jgi:hypothetical protein
MHLNNLSASFSEYIKRLFFGFLVNIISRVYIYIYIYIYIYTHICMCVS